MPSQRRSRGEWKVLIAECEKSGLSRQQFSADRGVNWRNLESWFYRLRRERRPAENRAATVRFVPVLCEVEGPVQVQRPASVTPPQSGGRVLEALVGNVRVRFATDVDCDYVGRVLAALGRHSA